MVLTVIFDGGASVVDVVAIHGLGGDSIQTWTHRQTGVYWPRDLFPQDVADARVMVFDYNAAMAFGKSTADIADHAKDLLSSLYDQRETEDGAVQMERPLVFIAHCLGGILVKQALFEARIDPRYEAIFRRTVGFIFFGTPHRGSDKAKYGSVLANIVNTVALQPSSHIFEALKTNSSKLLDLTNNFRHQMGRYTVVTFYETRPMSPSTHLIVETHSALLDIQGEDQIPVDANHQQICKFEGRENAVYDKLIRRVRRIRNSSTNQAPQATSSTSGILLLEAPNPRPTALAPDFQDGLYTPRRSLPTELHDPVNLPR